MSESYQDPNPEEDLSAPAVFQSYFEGTGAKGQGIFEWAQENPQSEYRLWLMTRGDQVDLQKEAERRLKISQKLPRAVKFQVALGSVMTIGITGLSAELAFVERDPAALIMLFGTLLFGSLTKQHIKELPGAYESAAREREFYNSVFGSTE